MYIGTSLGGCLLSLMAGEVSEDEVMFIVTRTLCPSYEDYIAVVEQYHAEGNPYARNPARYGLGDYDLTVVKELATKLYRAGKIHQPRVYANETGSNGIYSHPTKLGYGLWMHVVPTNDNNTPAVVEAYEKYKLLDTLTRD